MPIKVGIIQTVVPDYRKPVFDFLSRDTAIDFKLYAGKFYFEPSVKTAINEDYCARIRNMYFFKRKILVQVGVLKPALKKDILVLEMNPRILTNWFILILRRVLGKKTIVWGHAWPRNGVKSKSDNVRHFMRLLADEIIVYTKQQCVELQQKMPKIIIRYASNALYLKEEMQVADSFNEDKCDNIIYVGRLTQSKKALFLVKTFHNIINKLPKKANLLIVGEGEEKIEIEAYIKQHQLAKRVLLLGHVSNYEKLKQAYGTALISVSPGYVGLSITQSLGFGVPMLISKNENHSPELEAATYFNSLFFETDSLEGLSLKLLQAFKDKDTWINKREQISKDCARNYSIEQMGKTFIDIFKNN